MLVWVRCFLPDGLSLGPPTVQAGIVIVPVEHLLVLKVVHVVPDHSGVLRVETGGKGSPCGQVKGREDRNHLCQRNIIKSWGIPKSVPASWLSHAF